MNYEVTSFVDCPAGAPPGSGPGPESTCRSGPATRRSPQRVFFTATGGAILSHYTSVASQS